VAVLCRSLILIQPVMKRIKTSDFRKLSMTGFDLVEGGHNFYALLEFDITGLRSLLRRKRAEGSGGSLFAFLLKAIGKCLQDHPDFNAVIDYRHTTRFSDVDINIPVEVERNGEIFNKQYIIRDINGKSLTQVTSEIDEAKKNLNDERGFVFSRPLLKILTTIPRGAVVLLYRLVLRNHRKLKELSGSVFVTSVSMFSNSPGFVIPYSGGPKACSFAIGSASQKAVVINNEIVIREMINITAVFNHDIVDGAPAARFINSLRDRVERNRDEQLETSP